MKVKEAFCNEFKPDKEIKTLKKNGNLELIEWKKRPEHLGYSRFNIYDQGGNVSYLLFVVPDPKEKDLYKDFYLKYQVGIKEFLLDFFDVMTGEKEDITRAYTLKQPEELVIEQSNDKFGAVLLKIKDTDYVFGIISFMGEEENLNVAKKIVDFFRGVKTNFKDECGIWKELDGTLPEELKK